MNIQTMKKMAALAVNVGINLQKGQDVVIYISTRQDKFANYLVRECYKNGARKVSIEWKNEDITKLKYMHEGIKALCKIEPWEIEKEKYRSEIVPCLIHVLDDDPDSLSSIDAEKLSRAITARRKAIKKYRDIVDNINQWVIVALPSKKWAMKVFPNEPIPTAMKKLEDAIIKCMRLDTPDPVQAWEDHIKDLDDKANKLNELHLNYLHYTSKNGTDLTLHLNPKHKWLPARETNLRNISYCANMPTEEVFTMPLKDGVDGIVYSTKPLSYNSTIINDFYVKFKNGKVIEVKAKVGQDTLEKLVATDEGSSHLGEVALVPFNSPVNMCGCLFYETLFDENACCHLAFGQAFKSNFVNYDKMDEEDLEENKFNDSLIHVDFMIGSDDMKIEGVDFNGQTHLIFENGIWAI